MWQSSVFCPKNLIDSNFSSLCKVLALVAVRKGMDYVFSQHDLSYLDDVIPEKDKKKKEDEKKKKNKKKGSIDSEIEFVSKCPYAFKKERHDTVSLNGYRLVPHIKVIHEC